MKKTLLAVVFATLIALTVVAHGQTATDIQAQIDALLKQIQTLQAQLQAIQTATTTIPSAAYTFTHDLKLGSRGEDVKKLQEFLIEEGFLAQNLNTGYFGRLTKQALVNFQKSVGLPANGIFDSKTREYVNFLLAEEVGVPTPVTPTPTTAPAPATTTPVVAPITPSVIPTTPVSTTTPITVTVPTTVTPIAAAPVSLTSNEWAFVFTHRGTPVPDTAVNFICNTAKPAVISWIEREANKYQKIKSFDNIVCLTDQILLSGDLLTGGTVSILNDAGVINFLQNKNPSLINAKYVTVFHYTPSYLASEPHAYNKKYDFIFISRVSDYTPFYPALTTDEYAETLTHELMHKLGATDKYGTTIDRACVINPATGQQYSGYDIMCHRIPDPMGGIGFVMPVFLDLMVTEPTAAEINWSAPAITVISPNGGEQWPRGSTQTIRWSANTNVVASVIINLVRDSNNDGVYENVSQISPSTPASVGQFSWQIPDISWLFPAASDYRFQIWSSGSSINDLSDGPFSIVAPAATQVPAISPPTASLSASQSSITSGSSATLSWTCGNSTTASINQGIGSVGTSGSKNVSPTSTTTYTLTCTNSTGATATASATVNVSVPVLTVQLSVDLKINGSDNPGTIPYNSAFTASWQSTGAATCFAYGYPIPITEGGIWADTVMGLPLSGSKTLYARHQYFGYTSPLRISVGCWKDSQSVTDEVLIPVSAPSSFEADKYAQYANILTIMQAVLDKMAELKKLTE